MGCDSGPFFLSKRIPALHPSQKYDRKNCCIPPKSGVGYKYDYF
jgi:hypothetical protein